MESLLLLFSCTADTGDVGGLSALWMIGDISLLVNGGDAVFFIEKAGSIDDLGCGVGFTDRRLGEMGGGICSFALSVPDETE